MRAALYARFSTDNQSDASIADQLALCRRQAEKLGAHVVREFSDAAISGQAMGNRPGVRGLMELARAGGCDLVIAEHTDRLSRAGDDTWAIFKDLKAYGVRYVTVNQGDITSMHVGLSGTMSELMIEEGARKTRRGLEGVVKAGRSGGGLTYGYARKRVYDAAGEPVRGHLEIDEAQAAVVRRIFRDYAAGVGPVTICQALNAQGVAGPRGGTWNGSTIVGNARRGNGIIHNELYQGVRVWGRQTFVKDRTTGARRARAAAAPAIRIEVPELRIVPPDLWDAVRATHARLSTLQAGDGPRPRSANRPKRFLQGLVVCGLCGGTMGMAGPKQAMRCQNRAYRRGCANSRTPGYPGVEARVIAAIKANLLHPEVIAHAIGVVQEGRRQARREAGREQAKTAATLAEVNRRLERLVDQLEAGTPWSAISGRHTALEAQREALAAQLAATPDNQVVELHPAAAHKYRQLIETLAEAIDNPADPEGRQGREAVRALIQEIRFTPAEGHGQYDLEIIGDLAPILTLGTNEKGPLAGALDTSHVMRGLGAGTRVTRRHSFSAPFRQSA